MNNRQKLSVIIGVAVIALGLQFVFHQAFVAQLLITVVGGIMALGMFIDMIKTLRTGKYGVDLLAITAIVATLAVGEYWAALVVLIMLTGGDALEDFASRRANSELQALLDKTPETAHRITDGAVTDIAVNDVQIGDRLLIKPGEIVGADGDVIEGVSTFDEASLTGEARPIEKQPGDTVMSGSVNGNQAVTIQVAKLPADSQYQKIIQLVREAEARPAHFVRMADRYAVPFTLVAYVIAGLAWFISKDPVRFAQVLVVASPCPLILAAPTALISGMSRASRNGIIVKTGTTLEKLANARSISFDKTGTITNGVLNVDQVLSTSEVTPTELLQLAASVEQGSSHILARSLVSHLDGQPLLPVTNVQEVTANGVSANIDGHLVKAGKLDFVTERSQVHKQNQTAVYVSRDDTYLGAITFVDTMRAEAPATMDCLRRLGVTHIMMLTGDQQAGANQIAKQAGIDDVHAQLLPADKIAALKQVPKHQRPVIMVGDGVNDAPSLATADVGIAMGAHGSTAASESADAVIVKDDLSRVVSARIIAADTMRIAKESVLIGIFVCVGLMLIAATGVVPALIGALLQEVVDTVSILSALRARRGKKRHPADLAGLNAEIVNA
ncbi:MAG TPA: cadmium-translocating P-type ATPase [Lactobacillus sp.]|nr:cadmium-translocating P-type ATPase [Lactobacillus sp.]